MMKRITKLFMAISIVMSCSQLLNAQTFHVIIACNTNDASIGAGMVTNMRLMKNEMQILDAALGCDFEMQTFDGNTCTRDNLTKYINNMEVEPEDIVMFFYGGHGAHAANNSSDPWPQMCMNTNIESLFMPVASVEKLITAKNPRLMVIITECCNSISNGVSIKPLCAESMGPTVLSDYNAEAYKKLFLETKGKVMMTSSKLGQYSWSLGTDGGWFTNNFLDAMYKVGDNKLSPNWNAVCETVKTSTADRTFRSRGDDHVYVQEPYYVVSTNENKNTNTTVTPPTPSTGDLFKALQTLVNHEYTVDQRLEKVSPVMSKYFTDDAHVVTVGRNGTTKVMYEDVADFLRRLALSENIKQINILEGDTNGKNSIITVHEVRY